MLFDLEIYQHEDGLEDGRLVATHQGVDVQWSTNRKCLAVATKDGVQVARANTFDDFPIVIEESKIDIEVVMATEDPKRETYGHWILLPAKPPSHGGLCSYCGHPEHLPRLCGFSMEPEIPNTTMCCGCCKTIVDAGYFEHLAKSQSPATEP